MAFIPSFILILFALIAIDFYLGLQISKSFGQKRKTLLIVSLFTNLGALFFFKYFNFFNENISALAHALNWNYPMIVLQIALPLGLSFHIFQSLSYVIEVYRGKQEPEHNLGIYALYVMFFPQLVAGPIERPQHMLHQFHEPHSFNVIQIRQGLELMLWGFFKKIVIADKIAPIVNMAYSNLDTTNGFSVLIATIAFSYQLYCDFSGYSDIAVGSALVFGYDLTNNFNRPFSARSIADFWRRWHISLSSWLRDYLYYPLALAGNKVTKTWINISLLLTFTLIGLWHGANWTYVVFGALHGVYTVFAIWTAKARKQFSEIVGLVRHKSLEKIWQIFTTFTLVTISFIFFRSENVEQSFRVFSKISRALSDFPKFIVSWQTLSAVEIIGIRLPSIIIIISAVLIMEYIQYLRIKHGTQFIFEDKSRIFRWLWYYFLIFSILTLGAMGGKTFIYFQF
jgi:D-alanyl-lipoteichoic acid acyltransferase DltB (MBOAT superfamily)